MDKLGADFEGTLGEIADRLGGNPVAITYPIGKESDFVGLIHLIDMQAIIYDKSPDGTDYTVTSEIPENLKAKVAEYRAKLVEKVAETDDVLMEKYLAGTEITNEEIRAALRKATIDYKIVPTFCGTSLRNKGVQPVLDAVVDFLPSPQDLIKVTGHNVNDLEKVEERMLTPDEHFSALAFKIQLDQHVGKLTYTRIYSGTLESGSYVYNTNRGLKERVSRIMLMHANSREEIDTAYAGEIVALVGPKDSRTGDTLADENYPLLLEQISFPEPVISLAIEPKTKADQEKLGFCLQRLAEEDPTFRVKVNHETGQTIMSGMGELHLEILVDRMKREMGLDANTGKPQVAYKEAIKKEARGEMKYVKQTGGRGQYGHVICSVKPLPRGEGFKFLNVVRGGHIPNEYIGSVEKGVKEALEKGVLLGFPMVDVEFTLIDGSYHEVDSSDIAFKIAGSMAFVDACKAAGISLLEPIMRMEINVPDEFMGTVIGDISSKRGSIASTEKKGKTTIIKAVAPLSELSGYVTTLRSLTQGRGTSYMEPSHYEEVPMNIVKEMQEK
jgi:elongation factor G